MTLTVALDVGIFAKSMIDSAIAVFLRIFRKFESSCSEQQKLPHS